MSSDNFIDNDDLGVLDAELEEVHNNVVHPADRVHATGAFVEETSLVVQSPEKKYSVSSSQQFSQFLNKDASSRYRAIVLNAWEGEFASSRYEVGLVEINNSDHRNGVIYALR